jgi:hypothetical protein
VALTSINVRVSAGYLRLLTQKSLNIDVNAQSRHADNTLRLDWRFNSKERGRLLYEEIFVNHPEVLDTYKHALGEVQDEEKLHINTFDVK